jgi:hypothetical protein
VFPAPQNAASNSREDADGDLTLSDEPQTEIEDVSKSIRLVGVSLTQSPKPWQHVELSIPKDIRIVRPNAELSRELPSMLWDQATVQIDRAQYPGLPSDREPTPSESQVDFAIDLLPSATDNNEVSRTQWASLRDIRVDGIRSPMWFVRIREEEVAAVNPAAEKRTAEGLTVATQQESIGNRSKMESDAAEKILTRLGLDPNVFELIREDSKDSLSELKPNAPSIQPTILLEAHHCTPVSIYSEFWVSYEGSDSTSISAEPTLKIDLSVPSGSRPQWVCINGRSVPFVESANGITLEFPRLGKLNYFEYWLETGPRMEPTSPSLRFGAQPSNMKGFDARRIHTSALPANGTSSPVNTFELEVIYDSQQGQDSGVKSRKYLSEAQSIALRLEQWEGFLDSESLRRQDRGVVILAAKRSKACIDRLIKLTADGVLSNSPTAIGLSVNERTTGDEMAVGLTDEFTVDFPRWGQLLGPYSTFDASLGLGGQSTSGQSTSGSRATSGSGATSSTSSTESVGHIDRFEQYDRFEQWSNQVYLPTFIRGWLNVPHWPQWVFAAIPIILCVGYLGIGLKYRAWLQQRPWWDLLLLGLGWFAWTGSLWLGLVFCLFAAVIVCDTYWLISVRSRQNALRGPR